MKYTATLPGGLRKFTCCIFCLAYEILGNPIKRRSYDSVDPEFDDDVPPVSNNNKEKFYEVFTPVFERNARYDNKSFSQKWFDLCWQLHHSHLYICGNNMHILLISKACNCLEMSALTDKTSDMMITVRSHRFLKMLGDSCLYASVYKHLVYWYCLQCIIAMIRVYLCSITKIFHKFDEGSLLKIVGTYLFSPEYYVYF